MLFFFWWRGWLWNRPPKNTLDRET